MLKSKANWRFIEETEVTEDLSITDKLLFQRDLVLKEEQEKFLKPKISDIQAPIHLLGMDIAYQRIMQAIDEQEHIVIYGDYDADGVTSTALLVKTITDLGGLCDFYIPNRFTEGYGLHLEAVKQLADEGVTLLITVDTGISSVEAAAYAKEIGLDLIITDHHEMQDELPAALAIIHPQLSPDYEFKNLAGVGVAFQLAHRLLGEFPTYLLDFAAIGTIADLVPLVGENRVIATYGLKQLTKTEHIGLQALKKSCNLEGNITGENVGFLLAPRINAVGRLQDASLAVELLLSEDEAEANEIVAEVEAINKERQKIVEEIVQEAETMVDPSDGVIILYNENWHEGVLGIAASRLVNKFARPVIMLNYRKETGQVKGSARSLPYFNLFENCMEINHLFTNFGGHAQAAGMTFPLENLGEIQGFLNEKVSETITDGDFKKEITIDQSLFLEELTEELVTDLEAFAPFGMGNEQPIFHISAVPHTIRQIGNDNNHLKIQFKTGDHLVEAIGFRIGNLYNFIDNNSEVSVIGKLQINVWNGNKTVQMIIEDISVDEWQLFDYRGKQNHIDLRPFMTHYKRNLLVTNEEDKLPEAYLASENITVISYDDLDNVPQNVDMLYLYDLPDDLQKLEQILQRSQPASLHISYGNTSNAYLEMIPTRDDFKWMYSYLVQFNPVKIRVDLAKIMQLKGWTKDRIVFIIQVFLDLEFITVVDSIVRVNPVDQKRALSTSKVYQRKEAQGNIEQLLYYSTYDDLKKWFTTKINEEITQGEVIHEL